ncbi:Ig-like domain-containing protein [Catenovulum adriaticum]|uniref:BNR-4 repeat-containing protein n=1 Tax=Catenovulum adriaticum TaxID=2984846 RepID=A0ABY7AQ72_9ALTE|nr:Ig-like domain-containing protein [Catenovulum sp. TS8]WAJ71703.1 BNR-4 repeat-containing protein [Catenovulum sp. TS8]
MNNITSCIPVGDDKSATGNCRSRMKGVDLILKSLVKTSSKLLTAALLLTTANVNADVTLESDTKIADNGLYFDGSNVGYNVPNNGTDVYDFHFGRSISAHGDAVKTYKHYVFMTWYRGGKDDRHVMLTRLNTLTGKTVDIEFPHQHTGFRGDWWIGESHNTIGLAVSPINGTIHMVFDMHAYDDNNYDGKFKDDFFRYSYSVPGAAELPDADFTLDKFVKDTSEVSQGDDDYKHLTMTGDIADKGNFARLTYPKFFETTDGTLLLYMRLGGNNNGAYIFNRYDAENQKWSKFTPFNHKDQKTHGNPYNWGLYGNMKYLNGKLRVGFQQRSNDNDDKYKYQNGVYYAYSDHPQGDGDWKNHKGEPMTYPLVNSDEIKVFEPGDYITHEQPNSVYIVKDFDWTVTARGDIHIISLVQTNNNSSEADKYGFADVPKEKVYIHSYKPAGAEEFIIDTDFVGATSIYTAGDNIYIIGLNNGRPYVEMAAGGTSIFTRVYEATDGPTFAHGTIYIHDGKVYYYLQERGSGNSLPLHLQIIDLDIPTVSVNFDQPELTLIKDYSSVLISATPSIKDPARSIASVSLYVDDELVSTLNAAPFTWTESETKLQNLALGSYTVKALVTDDTGATSETFMTLNVVEGTPTVEFVKSDITVVKDYTNLEINVDASTPDSARTIDSVSLYLDDTLISTLDTAPYKWSNTEASLKGLAIGDYVLKAVVDDSKGETAETTSNLSVVDPTPSASFSQETYTVSQGYSSFSLSVDASTPVETRTIADVALYIDGNLIRKESVAPYEWGHNDDFKEELLNFPVGTHVLKAIVTDSEGLTLEVTADLIVEETVVAPEVNFSESSLSVEQGYNELTIDVTASTSMSTRTIKQVTLFVNGVQISALTSAPYQWTASETQLADLPVGTHVLKAVATDSQDLQSETTMQIVVTAKETQPDDNDPEDDNDEQDQTSGSSSGGGSTTSLFAALIVLLAIRRRYFN